MNKLKIKLIYKNNHRMKLHKMKNKQIMKL